MASQQQGVPLQQYIVQKYGEDWLQNPEAVRIVEGAMMFEEAFLAGHEAPTWCPLSMLPGNWMHGTAPPQVLPLVDSSDKEQTAAVRPPTVPAPSLLCWSSRACDGLVLE